MPLSNYTELQAAISDWMARSDVAGSAADFIALAEARLNRELQTVRVEEALSTIAGSRLVDVSSLSIDQPVSLFIDIGTYELMLTQMDGSQTARQETPQRPQKWELDDTNLSFDAPADGVYPLRFEYDQKFALSDAVPTNDLLTNHPDLYLAASIFWGSGYTQDQQMVANYAAIVRETLPSVRRTYANRRKGKLRVEPGLLTRRASYNFENLT